MVSIPRWPFGEDFSHWHESIAGIAAIFPSSGLITWERLANEACFLVLMCMSNPQHRTHRASLRCQQRAIRIIVHGNTDETFKEEKNTGLGNWINIINHGQESAINGVCFLLGADHRRLLCSRDGNERLSWCCCLTRVESKVSCRVWLLPGEKQKHATHLSVKVPVHARHTSAGALTKLGWRETAKDKTRPIGCSIPASAWADVCSSALDTTEGPRVEGTGFGLLESLCCLTRPSEKLWVLTAN